MRLKVTPIGSAKLSGAAVAAAIVEYLEGGLEPEHGQPSGRQLLARPRDDGVEGAAVYYADSIEGSGAWMGAGAARLGLDGLVERDAFERVLSGRHPVTGERLLHARGSAGRSGLAVGSATRRDETGDWVYGVADVAASLRLEPSEVVALIAAGDARRLGGQARVAWLEAGTDELGVRWVADSELDRFASAVNGEVAGVALDGDPGEWLSAGQAAELVGVSARYVRERCRYWEQHQREITAMCGAGLAPLHAWIESDRDETDSRRPYRIRRDALREFVVRREPPAVRVGFDLTLTMEKSVSVLTMLTDGARQDAFVAAIDAANLTALGYMEEHAARTRRAGTVVGSEGLVVASYLHGTSRALDPFPHRHNIVANAVIDDIGDRKALDARALYAHAPAAASLATAELRWRLSRSLGVGWTRSPRGVWEIAGVPDAVIKEFSTRRREIQSALSELQEAMGLPPTPAAADRAAKATRSPKQHPQNRRELLASWRRRARRAGLGRGAIDACFAQSPLIFDRLAPQAEAALWTALDGVEGVTAEHSTFARGDVIRWIVDWSLPDGDGGEQLVVLPAGEVERLADGFLASDLVVELDGRGSRAGDVIERRDGRRVDATGGEPTFSTCAILEAQERIVARFDAGVGVGVARLDADRLAVVVAAGGLSNEQAEFVEAITTSGDRVQCAIGRPGTGKTFSLAAAARAWEQAGYRVLGAAVKGEAARHLGATAGITAETVAWYLAGIDRDRIVLDSTTVLVVDEASTIGDRDLDALIGLVERSGAVLRLVGDPAQHGAVPAGGMLRVLCHRSGDRAPELTVNQRQLSPVDRRAAEAVRHGHVAEAVAILAAAGQLDVVRHGKQLYVDMLTRWLDARTSGAGHPMVDRHNKTRLVLNQLAHRLLQADGSVAPTGVSAEDGREFCVGDEVIARRPNRDLHPPGDPKAHIRNGSHGVVRDVRAGDDPAGDELVVEFDHAGLITVPRGFFDAHPDRGGRVGIGLDHAYAVTSYAVQGATFPVSTSAVSAGSRRNELYVNLTRGRADNFLYAVGAADPMAGEGHLPRPPAPDPIHEVIRSASRPDHERPAWEIDPDAAAVGRIKQGRSLAELHADARTAEHCGAVEQARLLRRAEQVTANAIGRRAIREPPAELVARMPPRPGAPWLARRWDDTIAAVAVYRATRQPVTAPTGGYAWAIGVRPHDAKQAGEWDRIAAELEETVVAIAGRVLADTGDPMFTVTPDWVTGHLTRLASRGALAAALACLPDLYRRVGQYRSEVSPPPDNAEQGDVALLLGDEPARLSRRWFTHRTLAKAIAGLAHPHAHKQAVRR